MGCEAFEEDLLASIDGELTPAEEESLAAHFQSCRSCAELLRDFQDTSLLMRSLPVMRAPARCHAALRQMMPTIGEFDRADVPPEPVPPEPPSPDAIEIAGVVKWFNVARGFGFMVPDNGMPDVLLDADCFRRYGYGVPYKGTRIVCEVRPGPKGLQAVRIVSIDATTAASSDMPLGPKGLPSDPPLYVSDRRQTAPPPSSIVSPPPPFDEIL
jgi:cold shock CspA family protein